MYHLLFAVYSVTIAVHAIARSTFSAKSSSNQGWKRCLVSIALVLVLVSDLNL